MHMNIIFKENLPAVDSKYTILDLDTFRFPDGSVHTACCVIENIPILELAQTDDFKKIHNELIASYAQRNWSFCEQAIEQLTGKWGGELDTFYTDLQARIESLKNLDLDESWTPVITKK